MFINAIGSSGDAQPLTTRPTQHKCFAKQISQKLPWVETFLIESGELPEDLNPDEDFEREDALYAFAPQRVSLSLSVCSRGKLKPSGCSVSVRIHFRTLSHLCLLL